MAADEGKASRTAGEAGWHASRYNLMAPVPGSKNMAVANLFKGSCAEYNLLEMYMLSIVDKLDEHHPAIERFARRGLIANFDEKAALEAMGRSACAMPEALSLAICPTMGCNFDCPYCFQEHSAGMMAPEVQDDVVALAERMLEASGATRMVVTWFGGEPLMAPRIIESLSRKIMALVEERGGEYSANIITNGYLLTQDKADMLARCKVRQAQITVDGLGATHDATRHLAGGRPTFERIVSNLRSLKLPFEVLVRHNVHEANKAEMDKLEAFTKELAAESGNRLRYYPSPVFDSDAADARGRQVGLVCGSDASEVGLRRDAETFRPGRGHYCAAHSLWCIGVDPEGRLHKCWEAVGQPRFSFGIARDWDPANPLATAADPNMITTYLNTACPVPDTECRECVWLPRCVGGCPHKRLFEARQCVAYKDAPESFVLALHSRIGKDKKGPAHA